MDELIKNLTEAFENMAFTGILKMNLQPTQEALMYRIFNNQNSQQCRSDGHLTLNGSFAHRMSHDRNHVFNKRFDMILQSVGIEIKVTAAVYTNDDNSVCRLIFSVLAVYYTNKKEQPARLLFYG